MELQHPDDLPMLLPELTSETANRDPLLGRLRLGMCDNRSDPFYELADGKGNPVPNTIEAQQRFAEGFAAKTGKADMVHAVASSSRGHFEALMETVRHFGGFDGIAGKRLIELGGGTELRGLRMSLALKALGAEVSVVDKAYYRSSGMFVSSGIREYLESLPDGSVDGFIAFGVLEEKSDPGSIGSKLLLELHDSSPGAFNLLAGHEHEDYLRNRVANSTASEGYVLESYHLLARKLNRGGLVIANNVFEEDAPSLDTLKGMGFELDRIGRIIDDPDAFVLWVLKHK